MSAADEAIIAEIYEAGRARDRRVRLFLHGGEDLLGVVSGLCWKKGAFGAPLLVIRTPDGVRAVSGRQIACYRIMERRTKDE